MVFPGSLPSLFLQAFPSWIAVLIWFPWINPITVFLLVLSRNGVAFFSHKYEAPRYLFDPPTFPSLESTSVVRLSAPYMVIPQDRLHGASTHPSLNVISGKYPLYYVSPTPLCCLGDFFFLM